MHGKKSIVRMEKNAVNKLGLFLIILIAIAFFGGGGYLLYKNRNNLDFSFPWEKSNNNKETKEEEEKRKKIALERQKVVVEQKTDFVVVNINIRILSVSYSVMDGYVFKIQFYNPTSQDRELDIKYLVMDGYQIDVSDKIELKGSEAKLYDLKIPVEELDKYGFETFQKMTIYFDTVIYGQKGEKEGTKTITITNDEYTNNTQLPSKKNNMGKGAKLTIDYYKTEETEETTDIYFLLTNDDNKVNYDLRINAYKINDTIATNNDFNERIYFKCKKVVILSIPKKDYKKVDKLTLSFFVLENNDIYLTKETTIDLTKK